MKLRCTWWTSVIAIGCACCAGWAGADVNVSLTISGNLDEILAIVQHLKQVGIGVEGADANDPLKLRIHSVQTMSTTTAPAESAASTTAAEPPPPPKPEPTLALRNPAAMPVNPSPGSAVLVSVEAVDKERRIDTLAATLAKTNLTVDLRDDGQQGDAIAGDGLWSGSLQTPADAAGPYEIQIIAYDANGHPLMALNQDQILANVSTVTTIDVPR